MHNSTIGNDGVGKVMILAIGCAVLNEIAIRVTAGITGLGVEEVVPHFAGLLVVVAVVAVEVRHTRTGNRGTALGAMCMLAGFLLIVIIASLIKNHEKEVQADPLWEVIA